MVVGRLAPSPTGAQHIGNARTFLAAWLSIRSRSGKVILRIEDIDSPRIKSWAFQQAIDDLRWLGLDWDEGPDKPGANAPYVQTKRQAQYENSLQVLKQAEQIYPCTCSRSDVASAASAPHDSHQENNPNNNFVNSELVYPRTCFKKKAADAPPITTDRKFAWRFRMPTNNASFCDVFSGVQTACLCDQIGDFVIYKSDGSPSYQLAVAQDDYEMGITDVLRGDDLIPSTFRQIAIYDFFGWPQPTFCHLPLVVGTDGRRLAKRHGDTRMNMLREQGVSSERLIGFLAHSLGWIDKPAEIRPKELLAKFDLKKIPHEPFVFDNKCLKFLLS